MWYFQWLPSASCVPRTTLKKLQKNVIVFLCGYLQAQRIDNHIIKDENTLYYYMSQRALRKSQLTVIFKEYIHCRGHWTENRMKISGIVTKQECIGKLYKMHLKVDSFKNNNILPKPTPVISNFA